MTWISYSYTSLWQPLNRCKYFYNDPLLSAIRIWGIIGKNGPPDHFGPISVDKAKVLVFWCLINLSHSGEGWSMLPVFPHMTLSQLDYLLSWYKVFWPEVLSHLIINRVFSTKTQTIQNRKTMIFNKTIFVLLTIINIKGLSFQRQNLSLLL